MAFFVVHPPFFGTFLNIGFLTFCVSFQFNREMNLFQGKNLLKVMIKISSNTLSSGGAYAEEDMLLNVMDDLLR